MNRQDSSYHGANPKARISKLVGGVGQAYAMMKRVQKPIKYRKVLFGENEEEFIFEDRTMR